MNELAKLYAWPLKPGSKTTGSVASGPAPGIRQMICRAELQDGLPSRPWQVVVCNLGPLFCDFFLEIGDEYGTTRSSAAGVDAMMVVQDVPPFGGVPVPPFVGNFWSFQVVGRSVTVYGACIGAFVARPNLYASCAPQSAAVPMVEP